MSAQGSTRCIRGQNRDPVDLRGAILNADMTTSEIHQGWPSWATTRPDDIFELLPPEEWGPWGGAQSTCMQSNSIASEGQMAPHPAEPPHFFHCGAHLERVRKVNRTTRPSPARERGRCITCGKPAERRPVTMVYPVACLEAERTGQTVARLMTKAYCQSCNPRSARNLPLCRGRKCRETGQQRPVQRPGCCNITRTSRRRHCATCCRAAARSLAVQIMPAETRTAGAAAIRKRGDKHREEVGDLHRQGLDNKAIAERLGVNVRTVQRHLKNAGKAATDQT